MIPIDITAALEARLASDRRDADGLLHASTDLVGSLRHSMLRAANAPMVQSALISDIRMRTGTMWHDYFDRLFADLHVPVMREIKLDPWMPEGWSGTADWLFFNPETSKYALGDLKTMKGEAYEFRLNKGISEEHLWQVSAYYWALVRAGFDMEELVSVYYLPMNNTQNKYEIVQPLLLSADPMDQETVEGTMRDRWEQTKNYLYDLPPNKGAYLEAERNGHLSSLFLTDKLAPVQERVQKMWWNKKTGVWDVKLAPHWSAQFCPYPDDLCDCSSQGTNKIGHWTIDGAWVPYQLNSIAPTVEPKAKEYRGKRN